jgi:hypothetical protein
MEQLDQNRMKQHKIVPICGPKRFFFAEYKFALQACYIFFCDSQKCITRFPEKMWTRKIITDRNFDCAQSVFFFFYSFGYFYVIFL